MSIGFFSVRLQLGRGGILSCIGDSLDSTSRVSSATSLDIQRTSPLDCPYSNYLGGNEAKLSSFFGASLKSLVQTDEQRRALDENGLRYIISMRSFYILNQRASQKSTLPPRSAMRERLRYRDMIWAFHSESQDLLLNSSIAACGGKLTWSEARALGIPLWLNSPETLVGYPFYLNAFRF